MRLHRFTLLALLIPLHATADIYRVGSGGTAGSCTHGDVQSAVDAAAAHTGPDIIQISKNGSGYTAQAVHIDNQDVTLVGGFDTCQSPTASGRTRLSGAGGAPAPVLTIESTSGTPVQVQLEGLEIVEGDNSSESQSGGGLSIRSLGTVSVTNTRVADNHALYGAGIAIRGDQGDSASTLVISDDVQIEDNVADTVGGGIDVDRAHLELGGLDTTVRHNMAPFGGAGIWLHGMTNLPASADIRFGGQGADGILSNNIASKDDDGFGGGIFVGTYSTLRAYTTDPSRPVRIDHNIAAYGAAITAYGETAQVFVHEGIIDGNLGLRGAALYASNGAHIRMASAAATDAPPGTVSCPAVDPCNLVLGNNATGAGYAAIFAVLNNGPNSTTLLELENVVVAENIGKSLFSDLGSNAPSSAIHVQNSRIAPNFDVTALARFDNGTQFSCDLCTIASNGGGGGTTAPPLFDTNGALRLSRSIIWQPDRDIIGGQTPSALIASALLLHDDIDFPVQSDIRRGDPLFVAQDAGDFHLSSDSPALDSTSQGDAPSVDLDGYERSVDLPEVANLDGPVDLGAYEVQSDVIFADDFE